MPWPVSPLPSAAHPDAPYTLDLRRYPVDRPMPEPEFAPRGIRLMASIPQAIPISMASAAIRLLTKWLACCDEPHWQSMVVAAT